VCSSDLDLCIVPRSPRLQGTIVAARLSEGYKWGDVIRERATMRRCAILLAAVVVVAVGLVAGYGAEVKSDAAKADNATAKFLGPEADWSKCRLTLKDVQGLWGGRDVYVDGGGDCIIRVVKEGQKEQRFRLKLDPKETLALRALCIEADLATVKIERPKQMLPDTSHPTLILSNAAGEKYEETKYGDSTKAPAFDKVYKAMMALESKTKGLKPEFTGPYDWKWEPAKE
jgi:hypothetical protein